ncbi:hypothetical protein QKU48_gp0606 [Fadolivirus algeromassiliense]|jgi:hypothetical protein|uniref:Uncharacterized protein n=1 Tax=Fadolivirus FV1/VV64 TaxID=3070911 RepID=A0A7D3QV83_9VIRU|nr:hypothetical protein QKU48_gp0606 [Fadolivirus algeromassiliense]QKF94064.1 hypothetical protein Fadolivirus_1_606 [Fadolivirus FV1/VV64]
MSQTFGSNQGSWQGVNSYNINCNNTFIDTITTRSLGSFIRAIGGKCKNGDSYGPYGGPDKDNKFTRNRENNCKYGFDGMEVVSDLGIYAIAPICNGNRQDPVGKIDIPIGEKKQFMCPPGKVIKNIKGLYDPHENGFIGSMTLDCEPKIEPFIGNMSSNISLNRLFLFIILLILIGIVLYNYTS